MAVFFFDRENYDLLNHTPSDCFVLISNDEKTRLNELIIKCAGYLEKLDENEMVEVISLTQTDNEKFVQSSNTKLLYKANELKFVNYKYTN